MNTEPLLVTETPAAFLTATENSLAIGTRLNDFEITGVLGEGGFGIVYLAFDHSLQRTVAIKEYMPGALAGRSADTSVVLRSERHKSTFEAGLKSFINEARLLAQFDHPSLVKVYRFWEENNTAYMVMRHYDGHTLKEIVNKRPKLVTEAWLKFVFKQILDALDTLYQSKILHRDISPDNIIVQKNGVAVLLDFGSARQIIGDMTQGLTVILKPGYAPVEQYSDDTEQHQGSWTDIYAVAAVMYFSIMKSPPPISVGRVVKDTISPLQELDLPGYSAKFLKGITQALSIQPQDRPQSIDEFRQLLGISAFASTRKLRKGQEAHSANLQGGDADAPNSPNAPVAKPDVTEKKTAKTVAPPVVEIAANENTAKARSHSPSRLPAYFAAGGAILVAALAWYFSLHRSSDNLKPASPVIAQQAAPVPKEIPAVPPVEAASSSAPVAMTEPTTDSIKPDPEELAWNKLKDDANATHKSIAGFLKQYPHGKYAEAAQLRLKEMNKAQAATEVKSNPAAADKDLAATNTGAVIKEVTAGNTVKSGATEKDIDAPVTASKLELKLTIKPWGTVFVDGVQRGVSPPLKHLSLFPGKHKIRVTNPGFPDFVTDVGAGRNSSVNIEHEFTNK